MNKSPRVNFKVYKRKIDIFVVVHGQWLYRCSTNASPTCKAAVAAFLLAYPQAGDVRARFAS